MEIPLKKPGLFITGTDTEVGKTVITAAITTILQEQGHNVGVSKPVASGCTNQNNTLIAPDALILQNHAKNHIPLDLINPVRYEQPLAPAVAAKLNGQPLDARAIKRSLKTLDKNHTKILVEGIGGILVPLNSRVTLLDLAVIIGYPVLVVTRPDLGTLNHTALTCLAIKNAGLKLAGIIINRYPDEQNLTIATKTNPTWLGKQSRTSVLTTVPEVQNLNPMDTPLPDAILNPLRPINWAKICQRQNHH